MPAARRWYLSISACLVGLVICVSVLRQTGVPLGFSRAGFLQGLLTRFVGVRIVRTYQGDSTATVEVYRGDGVAYNPRALYCPSLPAAPDALPPLVRADCFSPRGQWYAGVRKGFGIFTDFYPNGTPASLTFFAKGQEWGPALRWGAKGQLLAYDLTDDFGLPHGISRRYSLAGKLTEEMLFHHGTRVYAERYYSDGRPRERVTYGTNGVVRLTEHFSPGGVITQRIGAAISPRDLSERP